MLTATQSFTTLKAIPLADRDTVQVLTRAVDGDNGGGLFRYDAQATNPDDDGLTLAPADGIGRWFRVPAATTAAIAAAGGGLALWRGTAPVLVSVSLARD